MLQVVLPGALDSNDHLLVCALAAGSDPLEAEANRLLVGGSGQRNLALDRAVGGCRQQQASLLQRALARRIALRDQPEAAVGPDRDAFEIVGGGRAVLGQVDVACDPRGTFDASIV
jgi:hypothetical protein